MLQFTNSLGESVEFKKGHAFRVSSISGIGGAEANVQMQKSPYQDGSSYVDSQLEPRPITLEFMIFSRNRNELYEFRRVLSKVFNSKHGLGSLKYNFAGVTRQINSVVESGPIFLEGRENETNKFQRGIINLICPDPYWYDIYEESEPLLAWIGEFQFPFSFPVRMGRKEDSKILINDGDVDTPITVSFYGPSNNPKLINRTTGEFIKVNRSLAEGDRLEISTAFGNKRVEIVQENGERINVFNWIDLDSTFFQLIPGPNEIEYTADVGADSANVQVTWKNRYVGI